MTEWTPLGALPPISREEWEEEFARYKRFPEWQQRKNMTVDEFKVIFGWEYGHRMLGRVIGIAFCVPWLYFTARRRIPKGFQGRMVGLGAMGK
jgi:cytochrome c oxidase assembly protein subunit 15